jgi:hypothetical protein
LPTSALANWIIGRHLGEPVPQNTAGELLVDVRDTGADAANHGTRLYRIRAELGFHTDGADIVGLMCLRAARATGTEDQQPCEGLQPPWPAVWRMSPNCFYASTD